MKNKLFLLSLIFTLFSVTSAIGLEIPLLTWEQGKSQSVVLGGPSSGADWKVTLESESGDVFSFSSSRINKSGYRVFTFDLPKSFRTGSYSIVTAGKRSPRTVVANVVVVPMTVYELPKAPLDLLVIALLLTTLLSLMTNLRNSRYKLVSMPDSLTNLTNLALGKVSNGGKSYNYNSFERRRASFYHLLRASLLKSLMVSDANFISQLRRKLFVSIPVASILFTLAFFFYYPNMSPFTSWLSLALLLVISGLGILDIFSGLLSAIIYLALSFSLQPEFSIRAGLVSLLIAGCFVIPSLILASGVYLRPEVIGQKPNRRTLFPRLSVSLLGFLYIPFAYFCINSLVTIRNSSLTGLYATSLAVLLFSYLKISAVTGYLNRVNLENKQDESAGESISRIVAPGVALALGLFLLALFFNWTEKFNSSFLTALVWIFPLLLAQIRLESSFLTVFQRLKRSPIVELIVVLTLVNTIFFGVQQLPLLVQDRSSIAFTLMALPVLLQAVYALLSESGNRIGELSQ